VNRFSSLFAGILCIILLPGLCLVSHAADSRHQVKIGVLAYRGADTVIKMWTPTADYLSRTIPSYSFSIAPLNFHEINAAVGRGEVDFVGPYKDYGEKTLAEVLRLYWYWLVLGPLAILLMAGTTAYVIRLNKRLVLSRQLVEEARNGLEIKVLERTEEWERTLDAIADPVMILDTDHKIIKANKSMATALGVTPAGAVGLTCYESVHGTKEPPEFCPHSKLLADSQVHSQEIHEPRLGGHYLITVFPLFTHDGKLIGSIHAAHDISERKRNEQEREKLIAELQKALGEIKALQGILPICSYCKKIRDDKGEWTQMEVYISKRTDARFSHGICQECAKKEFPDYFYDI